MGLILDNAMVMGVLVFVITLVIKKAGWAKDGKESLWLVMGVSVLVAVVDTMLGGRIVPLPVVPLQGYSDPNAFVAFLIASLESVAKTGGVVLAYSQLVYHALRLGLGSQI